MMTVARSYPACSQQHQHHTMYFRAIYKELPHHQRNNLTRCSTTLLRVSSEQLLQLNAKITEKPVTSTRGQIARSIFNRGSGVLLCCLQFEVCVHFPLWVSNHAAYHDHFIHSSISSMHVKEDSILISQVFFIASCQQ